MQARVENLSRFVEIGLYVLLSLAENLIGYGVGWFLYYFVLLNCLECAC